MSQPIAISTRQVAVTPSDSVNFVGGPAEGLWIGVAGTLSYVPYDQSAVAGGAAIATTVGVGLFPCRVMRVNATGTAATGIVALY